MIPLPDHFNEWSDILTTAVIDAITLWLESIQPDLYPALIATGQEEEQEPNLEALLAMITAWELIAHREITPTIMGLIASRLAEVAELRGIDLTTGGGDVRLRPELEETFDAARLALSRVGMSSDVIDTIIRVPSWVDFIDDYATRTINLVRGMPETVYRDLVTKLAAATRDGMSPFERARLARDFLDIRAEGGYDQWMVRATRIARTESNRLTNAADTHAARLEQATTGIEMHRVWVATTDPRTRDTHFAADGQRVRLDAKFLIGGVEADFPGDPNLPPHESIGCRCTTIILTADEPLPDEIDRQTERERSDGTTRDPQAEVARRAREGVTRARDDEPQTVTAAAKETPMRTTWAGIIAPIGMMSGDNRIIDEDATITFREFPLPLMFQRATSGGHDTAVVVGKITEATADSTGIHATGELFDTDEAEEARGLVDEGVIRPSVDMADMIVEWEITDGDGNTVDPEYDDWAPDWQEIMHVRSATIIAATLVSKPAFGEAKIIVGEETAAPDDADEEVDALTAAAALIEEVASAAAFMDPGLSGPTALTVTDDGRVFGHLALWGTEHIGMPGRAVTPPQSHTGYALFHVSSIVTDEGPVSCGRLTAGCGHAESRAGMRDAAAHYDEVGRCWAMVRAGEDSHGIWVSGVVNPGADEATIREGAAAPLSGDWRSVGGNLELVAALSVNTPGFPVPRAYSAQAGVEMSLVAAGAVHRNSRKDELADAVAEGIRRHDVWRAAQEEKQAATVREGQARTMAAVMLSMGLSS